jgi:hypothetical protein
MRLFVRGVRIMAKQIKIFGSNWTSTIEQEVNEFIKDKNVVDIRYEFKQQPGHSLIYHNVLVIYEVDE